MTINSSHLLISNHCFNHNTGVMNNVFKKEGSFLLGKIIPLPIVLVKLSRSTFYFISSAYIYATFSFLRKFQKSSSQKSCIFFFFKFILDYLMRSRKYFHALKFMYLKEIAYMCKKIHTQYQHGTTDLFLFSSMKHTFEQNRCRPLCTNFFSHIVNFFHTRGKMVLWLVFELSNWQHNDRLLGI